MLIASTQRDTTKTNLIDRTTLFINAYSAKQQPNSTVDDVDHFLSFFADDFKDEHIKYGVVVEDKAEFKKGLVDKLQNKVYFHRVTIEDIMMGNNVAFVKIKIWAKVKPYHMDTIVEHTTGQIMSIEYDESGLIKHLRRHHN
ncbi:nuclear transport factor 2 family protein [Flagellimonas lutimaris]|uniref:Nuclear transport factor 2 family protein n=2 Tax=Flagellimonas lutimaris TaxID=475082 RepID=A0A3A1NBR3_9FLAO|nr:nuclear transport factor 2 family protein [Allomuricauda lutimaris]